MFKLASLFVEIKANDQQLHSQISGLQKQLGAVGVAIGTAVGGVATIAFTAATQAVTGFFAKALTGASDLNETMSKVETVFGDATKVVTAQADQLAKAFGLPKQAILDASASIGLVGKASGQSQGEAAAMSASLAKMAADAASFYNTPLDVALEKIRSGLVGEAEPLRAFGVLLSEEAVEAEALALKLVKSSKELDEHAKFAARASLITKGLADASGDLERTQGSTSNQMKKFAGSVENLAVSMGQTLEPAMNALVQSGVAMADYLSKGFEASRSSFEAFAANVVAGVQTVSVIWNNLGSVWEIVQIKATEMATNVIAAIAVIPENLVIIGKYLANNWVQLLRDAAVGAWTPFKNLGENIHELGRAIAAFLSDPTKGFHVNFKPLLDGFKATADALPALIRPAIISMQADIDKITQRMSEKTAASAAAGKTADDKGKKKGPSGPAKKKKEFASEEFGVADFASKLRASIANGPSSNVPEQSLESLRKIAVATEKLEAKMALNDYFARLY